MMVRQINDVEGPVNWQIKAIVDDISSCSVRIGSITFHYVTRKAKEVTKPTGLLTCYPN